MSMYKDMGIIAEIDEFIAKLRAVTNDDLDMINENLAILFKHRERVLEYLYVGVELKRIIYLLELYGYLYPVNIYSIIKEKKQ